MSLLGRLALLFVIVPLLELALLVKLGQVVGLWPTLAVVFFTGICGAALARLEGLKTLWAFRSQMAAGRMPSQVIVDGLSILLGGAFLLTPGILTDLAGFALLIPGPRRALQRAVLKRIERRLRDGSLNVTTFTVGSSWPGPPDQP